MFYGYHRTSTKEQHLDRGIKEIEEYCTSNLIKLERVFTDQQTGKNFNRPRYIVMRDDVLRSGDSLIITEIDRLGRNKQETMKELQYYKEHQIRIMVLELPTTLMNTSKMDNSLAQMMLETINNMMLELYASMAQAEIEKKEKRQREGIQAMKNRGEFERYGRPKVMAMDKFKVEYESILLNEKRVSDVIKSLKISKATYYRYRKELLHISVN